MYMQMRASVVAVFASAHAFMKQSMFHHLITTKRIAFWLRVASDLESSFQYSTETRNEPIRGVGLCGFCNSGLVKKLQSEVGSLAWY